MKKRLFLITIMAALLVCLLAVGISASGFESSYTNEVTKFYEANTTTELMPDWVDLDDKSATAVIKKADGSYIRIPLYYIYQEKGTEFLGDIRDESNQGSSGFRYAWLSEQLGETVSHANLVALEIPNGTVSVKGQFGGKATIYSALEELVIPSTVTSLPQKFLRDNPIIKRVFVKQVKDESGSVQGVTAIPNYFADITESGNTSALEEFTLELNYVTSIGSNAFMKSAIKEIKIEAPITNIGGTAFSTCKALETVYINNTGDIITIGGKAFAYSSALKSVTFNGLSLSDYLFEEANGTNGGMTFVATNVGKLGTMPFKNATNLSSVEISGPITSFGTSTFLGCHYLSTVKITNTLDTPAADGNNAFNGLKGLTSVTLHGISIGDSMFKGLSADTSLVIKATNVGSIGNHAFNNADSATEIYVSGPFSSVGTNSTFRDCGKLQKLTIINTGDTYVMTGNGEVNPELTDLRIEGKINIGSPVFQNNTKLKNLYLGNGVKEIGERAFYKCFALETVYLADTISVISDRAFDVETKGNQTSEAFTFVDENGNMDNTLPASLTTIGGHFLKNITLANTELIFPKSFTCHNSTQKYDFEGTTFPENFRLIYLGKMEVINLHKLYQQNESHDITVYLTQNSASDIKNERVYADVTTSESGTTIAHGAYAGVNTSGTLEIVIDSTLQNNIEASQHIKFYFCGSNEVCFVTRVNIPWGTENTKDWGNFVSTPVTYEQLTAAGVEIDKHPLVSDPVTSDATCTEDGGTRTFCLGCGDVVSFVKTGDATGHKYELKDAVSVVYTDYTQNGTYTTVCSNCDEDIVEVVEDSYLFTCRGYSAPENGDYGIVIGYAVNSKAVNLYSEITGKTITYGVFAVSENKLGSNSIFDENAKAADGVISVKTSGYNTGYFEIKVVGFGDKYKDERLALGAYVFEADKEATKISYIQVNAPTNGEKYSFIAYSDLVPSVE